MSDKIINHDSSICNKCGGTCRRGADDWNSIEGLIDASFMGGYLSKKWDLTRVSFSLCEDCLEELFASFKIPQQEQDFSDAHFLVTDAHKKHMGWFGSESESKNSRKEVININIVDFAKVADDITYDISNTNIWQPIVDSKLVVFNFDGIEKDIHSLIHKGFYDYVKLKHKHGRDYKETINLVSSDPAIQNSINNICEDMVEQAETEIWLERKEHSEVNVDEFTLNAIFADTEEYSAKEFFERILKSRLDSYRIITINFSKCNKYSSEFVEEMILMLHNYLGDHMFNKRIRFEKDQAILTSLERVLRNVSKSC